jgi:uncharacterized protein DUF4231
MAAFDYLAERLDPQIKWYDCKSAGAKHWFYILSFVQLLTGAAVPVLAAFKVELTSIAVVGGAAALTTGLLSLGQWQHLWIRYRATAEALKHEKYMFLAKSGPYGGAQPADLAQRCESLISSEHAVWASLMQRLQQPAAHTQQQGGVHGS